MEVIFSELLKRISHAKVENSDLDSEKKITIIRDLCIIKKN